MKTEYTARLIGIPAEKLERPVQSISYSLSSISQWADLTVLKYKGSVEIYESTTRLLKTVTPPSQAKTTQAITTENGNCKQCNHSASYHLLTCRTGYATHGACASLACECNLYKAC